MFRHAQPAAVVLGITGMATLAAAQTGAVAGVVVDATGGVLPGATVTLTGGPGAPTTTQTNAEGRFAFGGLSPSVYAVTVFLSGFGETTADGVALGGEPVTLPPLTLRLGAFEEAAVVTATRIEEPLQDQRVGGARPAGRGAVRSAAGAWP